jgi:aryl-alcohol dehydrogenase-like predicted oxidoreductase
MEKRTPGNTGMRVTVLGFGGAEIGFENAPFETVERLLGSALDAGLNLIDTAECYKASEEMIGRAVSGRRSEYFLFTKTGHASDGDHWNPKKMADGIDESLRRLRTDRVDLIQLHSCSEDLLRKGEVIEVIQRAREAGKTRFIGYSGDSNAARYAVESGAFDTLQTSVSIADQESIECRD